MNSAHRAACVIGWPIGHSRSPLIHNYWLKTYGIAGEYRREAVPPQEFRNFIETLATRGYAGANVTVPHKEAALAAALADDRANAVGAANTLWLESGALRATNTDVEGFLDNLDACAPDWDRDLKKAVVLGAGGAARAVVYGLLDRGIETIAVINRTMARAEALRERFGECVHPVGWNARHGEAADAGLLINTTTLGMPGQPALDVDIGHLPRHAVVADLVYLPMITPLLYAAQTRGLRTADGVGMLLHQAVRGFALWFGKKPKITTELRALLEANLALPPERSAE